LKNKKAAEAWVTRATAVALRRCLRIFHLIVKNTTDTDQLQWIFSNTKNKDSQEKNEKTSGEKL